MNFINPFDNIDTSSLFEETEMEEEQFDLFSYHNENIQDLLPIKGNYDKLPLNHLLNATHSDMDLENISGIIDKNNVEWVKVQYEKMGIKITGMYNENFYSVVLPDGWKVRNNGHYLYNVLLDENNIERARLTNTIFIHDQTPAIYFCTRYSIRIDSDAWAKNPNSGKIQIRGQILDAKTNTFIKTTKYFDQTGDPFQDHKLHQLIYKLLENYLEQNYPLYKDINAYW